MAEKHRPEKDPSSQRFSSVVSVETKPDISPEQQAKIRERKIRSFLKNTYPLSEEGRRLKDAVIAAENDPELLASLVPDLPTVENPRPELYKDLEFGEHTPEEIFGYELANVQVTKGCTHGCTFCAAGADKKVQTMPFPAIVKIAEQKRKYDNIIPPLIDDWVRILRGIESEIQKSDSKDKPPYTLVDRAYAEFRAHKISRYIPLELNKGPLPFGGWLKMNSITNYYDSDPFDAKFSFAHEDGSSADFGDVVRLLASPERPIHITTAGWPIGADHAQRAAEKIIALYQSDNKLLIKPRISISEFEHTASGNLKSYISNMRNVIKTMAPIKPEIMFFFKEDSSTFAEAIVELKDLSSSLGLQITEPTISTFLPEKEASLIGDVGTKASERDVMQCMPGVHIWPDGTIAKQALGLIKTTVNDFRFPTNSAYKTYLPHLHRGTRPKPIGQKLF